jgi:flavin-dependent dehydrogenase
MFDVIVVGGGPTGEEVSARLYDWGLDVALVEDRLTGGPNVPDERSSSRGEAQFTDKLLSAMRQQFGGYLELAAES